MLRGIALTVGLLAAMPAFAGEMSAEEARRFVIGKMFSYTCFEGTRGQGRVHADGSVVGSIQFQGAGPVRYAHLPAGTLQVKGESVCASLRGLPMQPCFNLERIGEDSFRGSISGLGLRLLRVHAPSAAAACSQRAPRSMRSRSAAAIDHRREAITGSFFRRKNHAGRRGVGIKLARAILEIAFRGRHSAAAMDDAAFGAHRSGVFGERRARN